MRVPLISGVVLAMLVLAGPAAWAQGGGASSTGTIQGRVTDAQRAVLPGVTVTATSPRDHDCGFQVEKRAPEPRL